MSVKTYNYSSKEQLTKNINISELKCKCGKKHDTKYDEQHPKNIQDFMNKNGFDKIIISSGYRCSSHDKKVGGSGSGQHTKGTAMDCCFYKDGKVVSSKEICCKAQDYGFKGIAYIDSKYVHLDNRSSGKYRGDERKGRSNNVPGGDFYKYFEIKKDSVSRETYSGSFPVLPSKGYFKNGDKGEQVKSLQKFLNWALGLKLDADGIIGSKTITAVKQFQTKVKIKVDGLFGKDSLAAAKVYSN